MAEEMKVGCARPTGGPVGPIGSGQQGVTGHTIRLAARQDHA
jgi:hypothetical protein